MPYHVDTVKVKYNYMGNEFNFKIEQFITDLGISYNSHR